MTRPPFPNIAAPAAPTTPKETPMKHRLSAAFATLAVVFALTSAAPAAAGGNPPPPDGPPVCTEDVTITEHRYERPTLEHQYVKEVQGKKRWLGAGPPADFAWTVWPGGSYQWSATLTDVLDHGGHNARWWVGSWEYQSQQFRYVPTGETRPGTPETTGWLTAPPEGDGWEVIDTRTRTETVEVDCPEQPAPTVREERSSTPADCDALTVVDTVTSYARPFVFDPATQTWVPGEEHVVDVVTITRPATPEEIDAADCPDDPPPPVDPPVRDVSATVAGTCPPDGALVVTLTNNGERAETFRVNSGEPTITVPAGETAEHRYDPATSWVVYVDVLDDDGWRQVTVDNGAIDCPTDTPPTTPPTAAPPAPDGPTPEGRLPVTGGPLTAALTVAGLAGIGGGAAALRAGKPRL